MLSIRVWKKRTYLKTIFLLMTLLRSPLGTRQLFSLAVMDFLRASLLASLIIICAATATVLAVPTIHATCPIVILDRGTFIGTTAEGESKFPGIPFAQPPSVVDVGLVHCHP